MSTVRTVALVAAVPSAALAIHHGVPAVALMDVIAMAWILAISRLEQWSHRVRVWNFLAMLFGVASGSMISVGALGLCYLMGLPIMAVILLGMREAFAMLALSAASMMVLGLSGHSDLAVADFAKDSLAGVGIFTLNFTCVGVFITLSCGTLLKGLSKSLNDVRGFAGSLEEGQAALHAANGELGLTSAALASLNDMVLIVKVAEGSTQPIIFANAAFERHSGYRADEIVGHSMRVLHGPDTDPAAVELLVDAMARRAPVRTQLMNYTKAGTPCWVEVEMVPFASEGGPITHWVVVGRDITEQRRSAEAIRQLAFFDVLTGLPNRRLLMDRLNVMVADAHAGNGLGALLYLDLDNFKSVNDARGHATGDALLKHVAARLSATVRKCDTVARLGGDEFVVLLQDLGTDSAAATAAALALAGQVGAALTHPVEIDGQTYQSSGSIGVALPVRPTHTVQDLLREADTAMYHAKSAGRNGVALFETTMLAEAENTLTLERDLAHAVDKGQLALHLQLQVGRDGAPIGAEVLLRWRRADGVLLPPDVFIPVAEASGLIVPIGAWVLRQSLKAWLELERIGYPLPLSINVSPRQFREPDFVATVRAALMETGVPPDQLILEVTEGLLVDDLDETAARMRELAQLGVRFSIDDFGTGYSNLAYLRKMPLYELKIDRSFLRDTPHDINGTAIVQSILAMAGHLGLRVMAEGVETAAQARFLEANGAPCMQGYLFGRPMPLDALIDRLAEHKAPRMAPSLEPELAV
ncbi:putative bifunctional diguanylate cyclase/phosphodiesterase [Massilia sp. 9096]|uniref:putative bifunctional diguanylate cyclase/phosphodiesterase n=1 Tax=Massilia sp. 9096 TaxID=1500894 RepID=UPI0035A73CE5